METSDRGIGGVHGIDFQRALRAATIIAVLVIATLLSASASAAVFNCLAGDTDCLINAITTANGNGEADTIVLAAGTYVLTAVTTRPTAQRSPVDHRPPYDPGSGRE